MFSQRLRLIRIANGLSLRDLQARIDNLVSAQAISNYERGESMPSSNVLLALANALGVSVSFLISGRQAELGALAFRRDRFRSRRRKARVEASILNLLDRYLPLEEILCLASVAWDKPREAPWPVVADASEAEQAASELRARWRLGADPIANMAELLEKRGVKVLSMRLRNFDALAARVQRDSAEAVCVIVVNESRPGERRRLGMARELGRLLLAVDPKVSARTATRRFAGAFLMPADTLRAELGKRRKRISRGELLSLKRLFGVSLQALAYRSRELGILSRASCKRLLDEMSRQGWRDPPYDEPDPIPCPPSGRLERLCFRALSEGLISDSRAAELLETPIHDVHRRMADSSDADLGET